MSEARSKRILSSETVALLAVGATVIGTVLASWADSRTAIGELRSEIIELRLGQNDMRVEWSSELRTVRSELKQDIREVRSELKEDIRDVRLGMAGLDDRLRRVEIGVASIQAHLAKTIDGTNDPAIP